MAAHKDRARLRKRAEKRKKRKEALKPKYPIQLDKNRGEHSRAAVIIEALIDKRKFNPFAVGGILIVEELERGEMTELLHRYSWIVDKIKAELPPPDPEDIAARVFKKMQESGKSVVFENNEQVAAPLKPTINAPRPLQDDDDVMTVRYDANAGASAIANFVSATLGLNETAAPIGGIKPIAGARAIAMPVFDD